MFTTLWFFGGGYTPGGWDGMFIHWYFLRFAGRSPFGPTGTGIDLRSYWMGLTGCEWVETRKGIIKGCLALKGIAHTHNAGEDAKELAAVFDAVIRNRRP